MILMSGKAEISTVVWVQVLFSSKIFSTRRESGSIDYATEITMPRLSLSCLAIDFAQNRLQV